MEEKTFIKKSKGRGAYELKIPIKLLKELGWLDLSKKITKEDKDEIEVSIISNYISKQTILIRLNKEPDEKKAILPFKRLALYKKNNQKERKSYEKRMKDFKTKIKEKQISLGMIEEYKKDLERNEVYEVENGKLKGLDKEERLKQLERMGSD